MKDSDEYIVKMSHDTHYEIKAKFNAWYVVSESIVRCADCNQYEHPGEWRSWCTEMGRYVMKDGFCWLGVRRGE